MDRKWLGIALTCLILLIGPAALAQETPDRVARRAWTGLENTANGCPDLFDYFPNGGIRSIYCHLKTILDYGRMARLFGKAVFLDGPHTTEALRLDARLDFGRYNPDFVRWLVETAVPAASDPGFRDRTQPVYDRFLRPLARTVYAVHEHLFADPAFLDREKATILKKMADGTLEPYHYEGYYDFANLHAGPHDGNVVKTTVAFWIRRAIDGTDDLFYDGLRKLMLTYDPGYLEAAGPPRPASTEPDLPPREAFEAADAELNRVYAAVREMHRNNPAFLDALQTAERAWIRFRDAHVRSIYLDSGEETADRSCVKRELTRLTWDRIDQLNRWIEGTDPGDACAGSLARPVGVE
jgi:uncharacterized protein YecT (DUF1311 family)